jgi:hypothetical protein
MGCKLNDARVIRMARFGWYCALLGTCCAPLINNKSKVHGRIICLQAHSVEVRQSMWENQNIFSFHMLMILQHQNYLCTLVINIIFKYIWNQELATSIDLKVEFKWSSDLQKISVHAHHSICRLLRNPLPIWFIVLSRYHLLKILSWKYPSTFGKFCTSG